MKTFAPFAFVIVLALAWILIPAVLVAALKVTIIGWALLATLGAAAVLATWIWGRVQERRVETIKALAPHKFSAPPGHRLAIWEPAGQPPGRIRDVTLEALALVSPDGRPSPAWDIYERMHAGRRWRVTGPEPLALPEPPTEPILSALRRTQRGLIVGVQDAGKSTLLRYLADDARDISQVAIID